MAALLPGPAQKVDFLAEPLQPAILHGIDRVGGEGFGTSHVLGAVFDSYRVAVENGTAWVHFSKSVTPVKTS